MNELAKELGGSSVVWAPMPGSQRAFLECPIFEVLYEGTRGPGKTDTLIMDFAQHVGKGYGADWRGVLFRQTYKQLGDIIAKTRKWFKLMFGDRARYNIAEHTWTWDTGEQLLLRHMRVPSDYWDYHGHAYPWIGWEELTNWPSDECYTSMMSCSRSTRADMPRCYRATTNPYGVGHNWVKRRFRLPEMRFRPIKTPGEPTRVAIHGHLAENKILMTADPDYISRIEAAARNESERQAWLFGSWDITAGGMFDDLWQGQTHVIPKFPAKLIPPGWHVDRAFDWGSSRPFSVGWWLQSNGEPIHWEGRTFGDINGDTIRYDEWYGWTGKPNEGVRMIAKDIAQGILDREDDLGLLGRVKPGPADASIYDKVEDRSVAGDMARVGVHFYPSDKERGSRKHGWEQMRKMMKAVIDRRPGEPREDPGLFVTDACEQFIRTVPSLPRSDKDLDDVDTEAEDHVGDEARYRCRRRFVGAMGGRM